MEIIAEQASDSSISDLILNSQERKLVGCVTHNWFKFWITTQASEKTQRQSKHEKHLFGV